MVDRYIKCNFKYNRKFDKIIPLELLNVYYTLTS